MECSPFQNAYRCMLIRKHRMHGVSAHRHVSLRNYCCCSMTQVFIWGHIHLSHQTRTRKATGRQDITTSFDERLTQHAHVRALCLPLYVTIFSVDVSDCHTPDPPNLIDN
ncbi:unnamed protein product [Ectocarpus sp. 12 AP-2014]